MYSTRLKKFVTAEKDVEEWLRSFADSFRSAQVGAVIERDSNFRELEAKDFAAEIREGAHAGAHR